MPSGKEKMEYKLYCLIHKLLTIGSSTQARDFQFIMLIWIEQIIIPVMHTLNTCLFLNQGQLNISYPVSLITQAKHTKRERGIGFKSYVSSSPAKTLVLAMRTMRLSASPTLIILA